MTEQEKVLSQYKQLIKDECKQEIIEQIRETMKTKIIVRNSFISEPDYEEVAKNYYWQIRGIQSVLQDLNETVDYLEI